MARIVTDIQFGTSAEADFENNTWTFLMPPNYKVWAGEFAIVDKPILTEMVELIRFIELECYDGSTTADLSHDFVDEIRHKIEILKDIRVIK